LLALVAAPLQVNCPTELQDQHLFVQLVNLTRQAEGRGRPDSQIEALIE